MSNHAQKTLSFPPTAGTLLTPLTVLIGREREVAAACTLLARPEVRLLTLTGTGGVGKTRLALEVAAQVQQHFLDGVSFVSLAPLRDSKLVLPAIVQVLGLPASAQPPVEQLQASLREKQQLLLLDNFEQVVEAAPDLLEVLAFCPRLKLLVTSREVLRVRGEHVLPVPALALPDLKHLPGWESLSRYGAVALFVERAQEVRPGFQIHAETAELIAETCVQLDGLPLALELAAARLKLLSLQELRERLAQRLVLLTGERGTCRPVSRRCATPLPGATTCSRPTNSGSSDAWRSLWVAAHWRQWRLCVRRTGMERQRYWKGSARCWISTYCSESGAMARSAC